MTKKLVFGLILTVFSLPVLAQDSDSEDKDRQYVTDQLRLSLYEQPSAQSKVLKLLQSGDMLIIDEIQGPYAKVTEPGGANGWVKRGFLVTSPTASILLREEREKNASLFDEIERLSNSKTVIDTYEKDMDALVATIDRLEAEAENAEETIGDLRQELAMRQVAAGETPLYQSPPLIVLWETLRDHWKIIAPLVLVLMAICFLLTKIVIEARIKSRFHGIKIW